MLFPGYNHGVSNATPPVLPVPLVLYDGDCGFCSSSMERWKKKAGGALSFAPSQSGAGEAFGFPAGLPMGAVQCVECSGEVLSGASAVLRIMELCGTTGAGHLLALYRRRAAVRFLADLGYRWVAKNRRFLAGKRAPVCRIPSAP